MFRNLYVFYKFYGAYNNALGTKICQMMRSLQIDKKLIEILKQFY